MNGHFNNLIVVMIGRSLALISIVLLFVTCLTYAKDTGSKSEVYSHHPDLLPKHQPQSNIKNTNSKKLDRSSSICQNFPDICTDHPNEFDESPSSSTNQYDTFIKSLHSDDIDTNRHSVISNILIFGVLSIIILYSTFVTISTQRDEDREMNDKVVESNAEPDERQLVIRELEEHLKNREYLCLETKVKLVSNYIDNANEPCYTELINKIRSIVSIYLQGKSIEERFNEYLYSHTSDSNQASLQDDYNKFKELANEYQVELGDTFSDLDKLATLGKEQSTTIDKINELIDVGLDMNDKQIGEAREILGSLESKQVYSKTIALSIKLNELLTQIHNNALELEQETKHLLIDSSFHIVNSDKEDNSKGDINDVDKNNDNLQQGKKAIVVLQDDNEVIERIENNYTPNKRNSRKSLTTEASLVNLYIAAHKDSENNKWKRFSLTQLAERQRNEEKKLATEKYRVQKLQEQRDSVLRLVEEKRKLALEKRQAKIDLANKEQQALKAKHHFRLLAKLVLGIYLIFGIYRIVSTIVSPFAMIYYCMKPTVSIFGFKGDARCSGEWDSIIPFFTALFIFIASPNIYIMSIPFTIGLFAYQNTLFYFLSQQYMHIILNLILLSIWWVAIRNQKLLIQLIYDGVVISSVICTLYNS